MGGGDHSYPGKQLKSGTLLKKDSTTNIFLRIFRNYLQLLSYSWDSYDPLPFKLPRLMKMSHLKGDTITTYQLSVITRIKEFLRFNSKVENKLDA